MTVLAIIRSLNKKYVIHVLSDAENYIKFSKYCDDQKIIQNVGDENEYINNLIKIIREHSYDLLIPVGARSVKFISKNKEKI